MHGPSSFRRLPRRLRRRNFGSLLPKLAFLLAAALLLRFFFFLFQNGGDWFRSIDTSFYRAVIESELGMDLGEALQAFHPLRAIASQSALLDSSVSYPFRIAADDGFRGDFEGAGGSSLQSGGAAASNANGQNASASPSPTGSPAPSSGSEPAADDAEDAAAVSAVENDPTIRTVTIFPSSSSGYDYGSGVYIKNETSFDIDVDSYLSKTPALDPDTDSPLILIVHTHASEAYYPDGEDIYTPTDTERTDDKQYNMIRVGDEMEAQFEARGYEVVHIREIFDYPSYNGSYTRTLKAIEKALKENPTISVVIDVHRDAMISAAGCTYRTIAEIGGKKAAQVLLVMGTSEGGLPHPKWKDNLVLAVRLQKQVCEDYPLLMRPINLREERFNQHATRGSMLVEMGTSSNTLEEALYSASLFTDSFCNLLDSLKRST